MYLRRRDSGFTLIELLIAIVIIGFISVPLGNVVISFLQNTDSTTARLNESHDAQIVAAYWAQDVASVGTRDWANVSSSPPFPLKQSIETNVSAAGGLYPCGAAGTPNALIRLAWDDFSGGPTSTPPQVSVAYVVWTMSGQTQLHRITCRSSAPASPTSDLIIAHDLYAATPPSVACSSLCTAVSVPQSVTITLTIKDPKNLGSPYAVTLNGQRRQT
jgi:prepilin-type N-terminal cleavage/methylation domain-containing protein